MHGHARAFSPTLNGHLEESITIWFLVVSTFLLSWAATEFRSLIRVKTFILETGQQNGLHVNQSLSMQRSFGNMPEVSDPYGVTECPQARISLASQVTFRGKDIVSQQEMIPLFDDACILASGIQWTVLCIRAKNLESE